MPDDLLEVGRVGKAHGVAGEVYVDLLTDRDERVAVGSQLWAGRWLTVRSARRSTGRWLVHFDGIDDRSGAERIVNATLHAEPLDDPDALWVHELIGSQVVDADGTNRGRCVAVVENPAHDLLELESGALVPVTFVTSFASGTITIDPPEGLFEL